MSSQCVVNVVSKNNIKVVLNLSGYAREDDLDYFKGKNILEKNI